MAEITVPSPQFRLTYEQKDITAELAPFLLQISYTDQLSGESDELEVVIEDRDSRWKNGWFPGKGDRMRLEIGYAGKALAGMGSFAIDEIEFSGPPDTITIRALAAGVKEALRTDNSNAFEGSSLQDIAASVADKHGLKLVGSGDALGRTYARVTQHGETDLGFLNRLGAAEGIVFSIKEGQLVWHDQGKLDAAGAIIVIRRTDMLNFSIRAKTATTYQACQVSYHDPQSKSLISHTEQAAEAPSGDTLKIVERCETSDQAQKKAQAALRKANGNQVEGNCQVYGDARIRAGCNVELQGLGLLDGPYQIKLARHCLDRGGGYITEVELATSTGQNKNLRNLRNEERQ
jgi:phage protein D